MFNISFGKYIGFGNINSDFKLDAFVIGKGKQ